MPRCPTCNIKFKAVRSKKLAAAMRYMCELCSIKWTECSNCKCVTKKIETKKPMCPVCKREDQKSLEKSRITFPEFLVRYIRGPNMTSLTPDIIVGAWHVLYHMNHKNPMCLLCNPIHLPEPTPIEPISPTDLFPLTEPIFIRDDCEETVCFI